MNIKYKLILFLIFISGYSIYSQEFRLNGMGGLSFSVYDKEMSLDLYDLGNNPAWLVESEKEMWLNIDPSISNEWGNYRRKYSSEGVYNLNTGVTGVKPLGNAGTFKAAAYYQYQYRRNQYRTLKKDTYAGEAFFFTDTTAANVRFNGPVFMFSHSLELLKNLYIGAEINYRIMSGLKKKYSYAETTYRNVTINAGLAYKVSNDLVLGASYYLNDEQEKITAEDVNLFSIESYQFRGETYAVLYRNTSVYQKVKKQRNELTLQGYYKPLDNITIGANCSYGEYETKILVPRSNLIDAPEGYSSNGEYSANLQLQYKIDENALIGVKAKYNKVDNWSKNDTRNLLIWEWNTDALEVGLGGSYMFDFNNLVVGLEYSRIINNADSSKYIDYRYNSIKSNDNLIKAGFELSVAKDVKFRGGINYYNMEYDLIYGGKDVTYMLYTAGASYYYSDLAIIDLYVGYTDTKIKDNDDLIRNNFNTKLTIRLFTF